MLGDTLFGINPVDGGADYITFKYEVGAGLLGICMRFTRVVVGNRSDPTAVRMINSIKYDIDHLLVDDGEVQVAIGSPFEFNNSIYLVDSIMYGTATCTLDEGAGALSIALSVVHSRILVNDYSN